MTKGKETSSPNKDGTVVDAKDAKNPLPKNDTPATKCVVPEKPAAESKPKTASKPKTELEIARDEIASLKDQLKNASDEVCEWKDKHIYLQAEFDNAEKRRAKVWEGQRKRMQADVVFAFLPLVDSFIPAVKKANEGAYKDVKQLAEGLKTLKQQLDSILKGLNVIPIDIVNVPFDYNLHEVLQSQVRDDVPDETVLEVVQVGWKLGTDVIRPAKVVVSKKSGPLVPLPTPSEKVVEPTTTELNPKEISGERTNTPKNEETGKS
ncbi:MAG: GrpE protein HSP-70 cofactor [Promethearchaeota archaeon CR_4]|nr:MAG: GrpE protein HSP-70 cofactor [Candidatus Lokiarchaeota archaeon CR_4]